MDFSWFPELRYSDYVLVQDTIFSPSQNILFWYFISMINSHHIFQRTPKFYKEVFSKQRGNVSCRTFLILILLQTRVRPNSLSAARRSRWRFINTGHFSHSELVHLYHKKLPFPLHNFNINSFKVVGDSYNSLVDTSLRSLREFDILIKVPYPVIFTGVQGRLEFNLIPMGPDLFVDSVRPSLGSFAKLLANWWMVTGL